MKGDLKNKDIQTGSLIEVIYTKQDDFISLGNDLFYVNSYSLAYSFLEMMDGLLWVIAETAKDIKLLRNSFENIGYESCRSQEIIKILLIPCNL